MAGKGPLEDMRMEIAEIMLSAVAELAGDEAIKEGSLEKLGINPSTPPEGHGDLAYPMFPLARILKKAPAEIAARVAEKLSAMEGFNGRYSAAAEGPYVNITIDPVFLMSAVLSSIASEGERFGAYDSGTSVILEHTSANPNGPLHVGRARNPIIGDTMARLLRAAGYNVEVQYYVNDMGRQVMTLYWGVKNLSEEDVGPPERDKKDYHYVRFYQKAHEISEKDSEVDARVLGYIEAVENGDSAIIDEVRSIASDVLEGMEASLARMNITIDRKVWESEFVLDGSVSRVVERLSESEYAGREEGALYVDLADFGIKGRNTKLFLTRSDGSTLYTTRDIAYHLWKLSRAKRVIDILGEDHKNQSRMLTAALRILGSENLPEVMFYSFVALPEGRMSTRKGRVVYLDDLLDEARERAYAEVEKRRPELDEEEKMKIAEAVGTAAVRYNIEKVYHEKNMTFRWEDALDFEGDSAPFIMYSYARACGILENAGRDVLEPEKAAQVLKHPSELNLVRKMAQFTDVLYEAAEKARPNTMAVYALELASAFNQFYRDCSVMRAEGDVRSARVTLVEAFRSVMGRVMYCLGITALDSM